MQNAHGLDYCSSAVYKIPLTVAMLSTATGTNNVGAFDFAGDSTTATGTG